MTKHITVFKLPALLIISFILSAYAFTAEEESVIRSGRSSATADASNGRVHQVYHLDPQAENDVSQHLPTATLDLTLEVVDERSYLRTSSGEQRRSLSFWSSIMNAIHCGLGHHDHCHHHHSGGGSTNKSGSGTSSSSGNGKNGFSKDGNWYSQNDDGHYVITTYDGDNDGNNDDANGNNDNGDGDGNNNNGNNNNNNGNNNNGNNNNKNGYYKNGNWYYENGDGDYVTSNSNGSSTQYDVYVVKQDGETYYYIDEYGDTVVIDYVYVETCTDGDGDEFLCIIVDTTTEGTVPENSDNSNDDPCWASPSSCAGRSGDGVFAALSVSDNPVINEIVFGAGFIGVATVAGLLYKKRYHQATNSQLQEHMLNGAVGKRRRTFAEVFSKDQKPSSGEQEMSTITRYVQA